MRVFPSLLIASALAFGAPMALADDLIIAPEIGIKFQDDVKVKKYRSHKWDGDVAVGTVITEDVEGDALALGRSRQTNKPGRAKAIFERAAAAKKAKSEGK
jgi:hypothetical protein